MKKLFLLLALFVGLGLTTQAQSGFFKQVIPTLTIDTLTDANTVNMQLQIAGMQKVVSIQPLLTKLTGTAAATVILYGSTDGTNYVRCPSRRTDGTYRLDTLAVTNIAGVQSKGFLVENSPYQYYRVASIGTGTQSTQVKVFAIWRKE